MAMMSMQIPRAAMAPVKAKKEKLEKTECVFWGFCGLFETLLRERKNLLFVTVRAVFRAVGN